MPTKFNLRNDQIEMRLVVNGVLDSTIVDFKSGSVTINMTKHFERYVGRSSDSVDDQFDHVDVNLVCHPRSQDFLHLFDLLKKRAQRQIAQELVVVNFYATLAFANGQRPKIVVPDLKFGNLPINLPSEGYADFTLDGSGEDYLPILT